MNHTRYLTLQEYMFQISNQSVKPLNLEIGEHRDIESQNYYLFIAHLIIIDILKISKFSFLLV